MSTAAPSSDPLPRGGPQTLALPSPWRIALLVAALICGVILVRNVVAEAHQVIGWAIASAVTALLLAPVIRLLDRHLPRVVAIVLTFVFVIALSVTVVWAYNASVLDQVAQIRESAPAIAADIEARDDRIGEIARDVGLAEQVDELTERLEESTGTTSDAIRTAAMSAPPYFVSMILTIFLLLFGRRLVDGAMRQLPDRHRGRVEPALHEAGRRTQGYVWGSVAQAAVNGAAIWTAGTLLDVPAVTLVAFFGAVAALVPYLGVVVGWLPVLLLALGTSPLVAVIAAAAVAIALQAVEAVWWRPFVDGRTLHAGPAVIVVVAVLGYGVYGIGAAAVGCVLAILALAFLDQIRPGDDDLPTPFDDPGDEDVTPVPGTV